MEFTTIIPKLLGNPVPIKAVFVLLKNREGITGRSLASLLGVSTFKMHYVLKFLVAQGVLTETVVGRSHLYRIHRDHILVQEVFLPLFRFQEDLFTNLGKDLMRSLKPKPITIILYGSVARGEEKPNSDLDLFLIYKEPTGSGPVSENNLMMEKITRKYGNVVTLRRGVLSEVKERHLARDELIRNIFKEGIVLAGLSLVEVLEYGR